jgi:hypothetical protein
MIAPPLQNGKHIWEDKLAGEKIGLCSAYNHWLNVKYISISKGYVNLEQYVMGGDVIIVTFKMHHIDNG